MQSQMSHIFVISLMCMVHIVPITAFHTITVTSVRGSGPLNTLLHKQFFVSMDAFVCY